MTPLSASVVSTAPVAPTVAPTVALTAAVLAGSNCAQKYPLYDSMAPLSASAVPTAPTAAPTVAPTAAVFRSVAPEPCPLTLTVGAMRGCCYL